MTEDDESGEGEENFKKDLKIFYTFSPKIH